MQYKLDLIDILHMDQDLGVFDVESRADTASVEVLHNQSLEISYLNRPGRRITSRILSVDWECPVQKELHGIYVVTMNSIYCFHAADGKFDDFEIVEKLRQDLGVMRSLGNAVSAFASAFA